MFQNSNNILLINLSILSSDLTFSLDTGREASRELTNLSEMNTEEQTLTLTLEPQTRALGGTEFSWYRAVNGGTGITVLSLLLSKPLSHTHLQTSLSKLETRHPVLRSKLIFQNNRPFLSISPNPSLHLQTLDIASTSQILQDLPNPELISPFHRLLEHELNRNSWSETNDGDPTDVFVVTLYCLSDSKSVIVLRLHTSICDRTSAVAILREFLKLYHESGVEGEERDEREMSFHAGIEEMIPRGKGNKPFWSHGIDLLGYSLNSMRLSNLEFEDVGSPRSSQMVRLQMSKEETHRLVTACRDRGIKVCGAIAAAGFIAARSSKEPTNRPEHYAVITLIDCRKLLDPLLHDHDLGFYHSAILNTHNITNGEELWDLATRCSNTLSNSMEINKHFTDMGDVNFLMCKAIDCPAFTPYSSLRTSFMVVFEELVIEEITELHKEIGLEDYVGCSSVHGVGPSIAVFDTIRDGQLDCACVYPSPLHSRKQIQGLVEEMKEILILATHGSVEEP